MSLVCVKIHANLIQSQSKYVLMLLLSQSVWLDSLGAWHTAVFIITNMLRLG